MIDWNNDGKIDGEDVVLTDIILGDDDGGGSGLPEKPRGSCLASVMIFLVVAFGVLFAGCLA